MALQKRTNRKWKDLAFVSGGSDTVDLPMGLDLESIHFYFYGSINVTTAFTAIKSEGLAKLIKKVELLQNGETIATVNGEFLTHGNFMRGYPTIKVNPGVAIANYLTPEIVGFLDLAHVDGMRAKDTNLRTEGSRSLQLRITWGTLADMYTGAGVATTALTLSIAVRETNELGDHNGFKKAPEARHLHRLTEITYPTSKQDRIQLSPDMLFRALVLRQEVAGELSSAVITNVRVVQGSEVLFDVPAAMLYDANCNDNSVALPAGYLVVDFSPSKSNQSRFSEFLSNMKRNDTYLVLDVVGGATNKVQILSHEYEWLHGAIAENQQYLHSN